MMNKFLSLIFLTAWPALLHGQCNTFFPLIEGVKYEYDHFDKKDKVILRTTQKIKNVSGSGNNMKALVEQEVIDVKKGNVMSTAESEVSCEDGTIQFAMNSMTMGMDNGQQASMGTGVTAEVTGDKMDLPSSLTVGQSLKDVNYTFKVTMSGVNIMNRDLQVKDRKVEAKEMVTTPAGTFECYRITFNTTSSGGIGAGTLKTVMWYAEDVGMVKTEISKEDGKITGRQVLAKVVKP